MKRLTKIFYILLLFSLSIATSGQIVNIAIVKDASENEFEYLTHLLKNEINALTNATGGAEFKLRCINWQPDSAKSIINDLFKDNEIDIIITLGYISSNAASEMGEYPKPVIIATVLDNDLQSLEMLGDKSSGINNFTWIESPIDLKEDIRDFSVAFQVSHLAVIIPHHLYYALPKLKTYLIERKNTFNIDIIPFQPNVDIIQQLPSHVDAALVFPMIMHSREAMEKLFNGLNVMKIPSLAIGGTGYLEAGATLTFTNQYSYQKIARLVATKVLKVTEGANLSALTLEPTHNSRAPKVNMESIRQIEKLPPVAFLQNAILVNIEKIPGEEMTLQHAIAFALENNLKGKVSSQNVSLAEKDVKIASSKMLPQLEVAGTGTQLSKNIVETSMGQKGEYTVIGSASLKQIIYSEAVFANVAIKKLLVESEKSASLQAALDVVQDVSQAYISLLHAKSNLQIKNDNLYITMKNLELAMAMESIGEGRISDVNRWSTEMNLNKIELNTAEANYKMAMYRLNEVLNYPIGKPVNTADTKILEQLILNNQDVLNLYFEQQISTERYSDFILKEMQQYSPELQQFENAEKTIERQKKMNVRQIFMPEVAFIAGADQAFIRNGTIGNPNLPIPAPPDDITWHMGVRVSIPIFEGGRKKTEIKRNLIEQNKISWQKEEFNNKIELAIRSSVQLLQTSYNEVKLSENAARAAEDNFRLTQNAYIQGVINVTQLIDAQNAMTKTRLLALNARSQYVLNIIATERLQGRFSFLEPDAKQAEYKQRLINHLFER